MTSPRSCARTAGSTATTTAPALVCYVVGIVIQVPFVANGLYTGSVARLLGGADMSWIVWLAVVSPLYYGVMKMSGRAAVVAG